MFRLAAAGLLSTLALGATVVATTGGGAVQAAPTTPDHTTRVVVRPVTSAGTAVSGYTVRREKGAASCSDQSVAGLRRGIDTCYPSAMYLPSCWKSTNHTALCLRDVGVKELTRVRYSGSFRTHTAVKNPAPQAIRLTNGATCRIRVGGAWGTPPQHPQWLGFYSCSNGDVFGPANGDGIDRSQKVWRVHILRADDSLVTRKVDKAYFVGTAH